MWCRWLRMDTNSFREDRSASTVDHGFSLTTMWSYHHVYSFSIYLYGASFSIKIRLSVPDLVSQLWRKIRLLWDKIRNRKPAWVWGYNILSRPLLSCDVFWWTQCLLLQLVTVFSAPNYCGEFDNAGGLLKVSENLTCSFSIVPVSTHSSLVPRPSSKGWSRVSVRD